MRIVSLFCFKQRLIRISQPLLLALLLTSACQSSTAPHTPTGQLLRTPLKTLSGQTQSILSQVAPEAKLITLVYWAGWCRPCLEEIALFNQKHQQLDQKQWPIVSLALDDPDTVKRIHRKYQISYPVFLATHTTTRTMETQGNSNGLLPFIAFVDPQTAQTLIAHVGPLTPSLFERLFKSARDSLP